MSSSMGGCFNLRCIGQTPLSKFTTGFNVLQKPLHDIYVSYLTPKGMRQPAATRLALTDRGIILTVEGKDSFYSMRDILLWEAVHWVRVQTKDKKFMSAFEPIDPDRHRGKDSLFSKLDSQYKYLTKLNHEPVLACVLRRTSGPKTIDVHAYVCSSEAQALDIVAAITRMQQLFQLQEQKPPIQEQPPASVRVPSGSAAAAQQGNAANGFRSQRQPRASERGDGEITLEELMRLADMAITDPAVKSSAAAAAAKEAPPPFRMGESWTANENQHGVRRAKTFNEGQKGHQRKTVGEPRNIADQDRHQSNARLDVQRPSEVPRGGGGGVAGGAVAWKELQDARYYENDSVVSNGPQRTYENLGAPGSIPPTDNYGLRSSPVPHPRSHQHQPQQQSRPSTDDRDAARVNNGEQPQMADQPRRKSVPPESLRMVIAESKAANRRVSVLPRADAGFISTSVFNLSVPGEPRAPAIVDVYFDSDHNQQPFQPNPSPKPVAMVQPRKVSVMVQPRKVSGVKVLPEPGLEVVHLQKVSQQQPAAGKAGDEAKKEQYQRGDGGGGGGNRNFTRSMFELNKPTTPQSRKKFTSAEPEPVRKFTSAEPEPARKFTSAEPDPVRKFTSAEPDPVRKFTSAEPDPVRKFTSAEPDPVRKFTSAEPDPVRKFTSAEPDPVRKFTSAEPDPVRKFTSADPEPARKSSNPEAVKRDVRDNKAAAGGEKSSSGGERGKKDAEIEAFAMNVNFYKPPTNTLSPHGTNFESALGYFP